MSLFLSVNNSAFYGLTNAGMLHLRKNKVYLNDIVAALEGEDIIPSISELYLSNITDMRLKRCPVVSMFLNKLEK